MKRITNRKRSLGFLRVILLGSFLSILNMGIFAQGEVVTGTVTDGEGEPIPFASVALEGTTIGTVTSIEGVYTIDISASAKPQLKFSYLGMKTQVISVEGQALLNVTLESDINNIDELVVVGYGTQKRISVTGAVNTIKNEELVQNTSSASVAAALQGRMPGTVIVQNSGMAGAQSASISIRGADEAPLILVDGVERDFESLDPEEIESITTLKDASATAVYGVKGASGVIIVTTKRGKDGPAKISAKAEFGLISPGKIPDMLDAYEYALLKNEGLANSGQDAIYTDNDLELFQNGLDPIFHPNHDWYDYMTNDYGFRQNYNVNISGGHQKMRYYTNIGYMRERDVYKDFDVDYDDRSYYERINLRSNLDIDVTNTTVLSAEFSGQFANRHQPNTNLGSDLTYNMFRTPAFASTIYDGKKLNTIPGFNDATPLDALYDNGYRDNHSNKFQFSAKLKQNLDFITKGLKFLATVSYDHSYSNNFTATKNIPKYTIEVPGSDGSILNPSVDMDPLTGLFIDPITGQPIENPTFNYIPIGSETKLGASRSTGTNTQRFNTRLNLNYSRDFGKHHVGGIAVFTADALNYLENKDKNKPYYVPRKYLEGAFRASYNYNDKYFVEFNAGVNASENFAPGKTRTGIFPAVSGGWVVTNEKFIPQNPVLTFLKLRASYGVTGSDKGLNSRFLYSDVWSIDYSGGYRFGDDATGQGEAKQTKAGNPLISWAENYQRNFAVETRWINGKLSLQGDIFENERKGLIIEPNAPTIIAADLPPGNLREVTNRGYEIQGRWKDKIGEVGYNLHANYNYAESEIIFMDELVDPDLPYQALTGQSTKNIQGLVADGFYSQEDIDALAANGGVGSEDVVSSGYTDQLQAGDMKYKDLNGDHEINDKDYKTFTNTSSPMTTYGFGGGLNYKAWSASVFFQGATDVTYVIKNRMRMPFFNGLGNGASYVMNRWTPERVANGEEILFPRIQSASGTGDHNFQNSDFWFRDASYVRLKNAHISYMLKNKTLKEMGISSCKFYVSGTNLFTWTKLDIVDPESKAGDQVPIPPNQVYTIGVNIKF